MPYEKLRQSTAEEASLLDNDPARPRGYWDHLQRSLFNAAVMLLCFAAGLVVENLLRQGRIDSDSCLESDPASLDLEISYQSQTFNGSFFRESIYRQEAGPAVDDAWQQLGGSYLTQLVSKQTAILNGLRPDHLHLTSEYGGGYVSNLFVVHEIHCLDLLRQALYFNVDYYRKQGKGAFENSERILRLHITHCLDMLRQDIMCKADITLVGVLWYQPKDSTEPRYFPDFNIEKQCRNFNEIRQWVEDRQMMDILNPPDNYFELPRDGDKVWDGIP